MRLLEGADSFYEGAYRTQVNFNEARLQTLVGRLGLPLVNFGYLKMVLETVSPKSRVLELGCGSGMQLAGERFDVTALDLSLTSLEGTPATYKHRIQANVLEAELVPASYDAVIASCFYEHFTPKDKEILLDKIWRWLRPGGQLILLFDTESRNPVFKWMRRHPELYRQCFVEHDGHVGLEPVSANRARFDKKGFIERRGIGLNRTIQHLPVYTWVAPYGAVTQTARWVSRLGDVITRHSLLMHGFTGAVHVWDLTVGRLFPLDWSRLYLGVWTRP